MDNFLQEYFCATIILQKDLQEVEFLSQRKEIQEAKQSSG
jgi:hypothetical protein